MGHFAEAGVQSGMGHFGKALGFTAAGLLSPLLLACSCVATPPPCQGYWKSPLVFLATVTDVMRMPGGDVNWAPSKAVMRIDKAFKGISEHTLTLYDDGMCDGPTLEVGEQYLMYTQREPDGQVPVRGCTRSRHVRFAQEDLKYLASLEDAAPTSRIFGKVEARPEVIPVGGATVTLVGQGETLTTQVDPEGRYSFKGLRPGKYTASASAPGFDMPVRSYDLFSQEVVARGCAVIDVWLGKHLPGAIAGRLIRFDGSPAPAGIDLSLIRVTEDGHSFKGEVLTDNKGEYRFSNVKEGRYKVVVHDSRHPTVTAPYRPIYWPDAAAVEAGSEIVVGPGEGSGTYDFHLPRELRRTEAKGIVLLPSGKAAAEVKVWILEIPKTSEERCCGFIDQTMTDETGRFTFTAVDGIDYGLTASPEGEALRSQITPLSFSQAQKPIVLVLDAP